MYFKTDNIIFIKNIKPRNNQNYIIWIYNNEWYFNSVFANLLFSYEKFNTALKSSISYKYAENISILGYVNLNFDGKQWEI